MWALIVFTCLDMNVCPVHKTYFESQERCISAMFLLPTQVDKQLRTYICVPQDQDIYYDTRLRDSSGRENGDG